VDVCALAQIGRTLANPNRFIKQEVWKKINANRKRAADVLQQDEREREALRQLNQKTQTAK
jgi:hypothetical protein